MIAIDFAKIWNIRKTIYHIILLKLRGIKEKVMNSRVLLDGEEDKEMNNPVLQDGDQSIVKIFGFSQNSFASNE